MGEGSAEGEIDREGVIKAGEGLFEIVYQFR